MKVLVVGSVGEVDVIASIDGSSSLLYRSLDIGNLIDGRIVAHHHTVEAYIAAEDVLKDLAVGYAADAVNIVIARHHGHTARQTDHRLVGQQDLFHQLFLLGITTTTVAEVVLRAGTHTCLQVTLLQTFHKGSTHDGREVAVLSVGLLQAVERRIAAHVDHG